MASLFMVGLASRSVMNTLPVCIFFNAKDPLSLDSERWVGVGCTSLKPCRGTNHGNCTSHSVITLVSYSDYTVLWEWLCSTLIKAVQKLAQAHATAKAPTCVCMSCVEALGQWPEQQDVSASHSKSAALNICLLASRASPQRFSAGGNSCDAERVLLGA